MKQCIDQLVPQADKSSYIHPRAVVIGDVTLGANVSVFPGAVLRGDIAAICVGANSNIQDNAVLHVNYGAPCIVGEGVSIGHGAVVHGSKIGDNVLIGMNAVVMESEIGSNCIIGAGAVIPAGKNIPSGSLVMGVPGKIIRALEEDEVNAVMKNARDYAQAIETYRTKCKEL